MIGSTGPTSGQLYTSFQGLIPGARKPALVLVAPDLPADGISKYPSDK
jgi:hypothetical protein